MPDTTLGLVRLSARCALDPTVARARRECGLAFTPTSDVTAAGHLLHLTTAVSILPLFTQLAELSFSVIHLAAWSLVVEAAHGLTQLRSFCLYAEEEDPIEENVAWGRLREAPFADVLRAVAGSAATLRSLNLTGLPWTAGHQRQLVLPALREVALGADAWAVLPMLAAMAPNLRWLDLTMDALAFPDQADPLGDRVLSFGDGDGGGRQDAWASLAWSIPRHRQRRR